MTSNGRDGLSTEKLSPRVRELGVCAFIAALVGGVFALDCLTPRHFSVGSLYPAACPHIQDVPSLELTRRRGDLHRADIIRVHPLPEVPGVPFWLP